MAQRWAMQAKRVAPARRNRRISENLPVSIVDHIWAYFLHVERMPCEDLTEEAH